MRFNNSLILKQVYFQKSFSDKDLITKMWILDIEFFSLIKI